MKAVSLVICILVACSDHEFHPPDRAAQVAQADSMYLRARFDTVQWTSDSLRIAEGNEVYAAHCDKCHGALGEGGTEYARSNNLEVPSLVRPDWEYGDDHDAVRRRIFTGHPEGMPTWGAGKLSPRDIDAVAAYVLGPLRQSQ